MAAVLLPREINQSTLAQTARPALRVRRRFRLVGFGTDAARAFTAILMVGGVLCLFAAPVQVLEERRVDLAVMRAPGATQLRLFWQITVESLILTVAGAGLGLATAHRVARGAGLWLRGAQATPGALGLG